MPVAPPRVCSRCGKPAAKGTRCPCRPAWEGSTRPDNDARMRKLREAKLGANPICERPDCRRPAIQVDHVVPHAEDPGRRYDWSNLQSLCGPHHQQKTTADALRGKKRAR